MQTYVVLNAAVSFIRDSRPRIASVRLIAIDGPSGSGKTDFALALADKLRATVIHLDDMYRGWDGLAETIGLIVEFIAHPLEHKHPVRIPTWDWQTSKPGPLKEIETKAHIIIEGVGAGSNPVAPYLSTLIWLDADEDVRKKRALERDGEIFASHWNDWKIQERKLWSNDNTRSRADLIFDTTASYPNVRGFQD